MLTTGSPRQKPNTRGPFSLWLEDSTIEQLYSTGRMYRRGGVHNSGLFMPSNYNEEESILILPWSYLLEQLLQQRRLGDMD